MKSLSIRSEKNPDLIGDWLESDVRKEMAELGLDEDDWLHYVLDHTLGELPETDAFCGIPVRVLEAAVLSGTATRVFGPLESLSLTELR